MLARLFIVSLEWQDLTKGPRRGKVSVSKGDSGYNSSLTKDLEILRLGRWGNSYRPLLLSIDLNPTLDKLFALCLTFLVRRAMKISDTKQRKTVVWNLLRRFISLFLISYA